MKPDYRDPQSQTSAFPDVRPEIVLSSVSEIILKDKIRPETITEVAPETTPARPRPEVVTEVAPETKPPRPKPEVVTEVAPETSTYNKNPRPEVVTEVAPETSPYKPARGRDGGSS